MVPFNVEGHALGVPHNNIRMRNGTFVYELVEQRWKILVVTTWAPATNEGRCIGTRGSRSADVSGCLYLLGAWTTAIVGDTYGFPSSQSGHLGSG